MKTTTHISPRQFAILIVTSFLALGLFEFPRELVGAAGPDALYAFLIDIGVAFFAAWLHLCLARRFPRGNFGETARQLMGPAAWPILVFAVTLHLVLAIVAMANFSFVMQTFFLNRTPIWVLVGTAVFTVTYVTAGGTTTLARTMEIVLLPTMVLSLFMASLMIPLMRSAYAIMPSPHIWLMPTLAGSYRAFYIFLGMEAINMLYPFLKPEDQIQAHRMTYWAIAAASGFLLVGYVVVMGNSGPGLMHHLFWPPVEVMRVITLNSFLINKLGLMVVLVWGVLVFGFVAVRIWALSHLLMSAVRVQSKTWYQRFTYGMGVLVLVGSAVIPNVVTIETLLNSWLLPWGAGFLFGSPLLLLGVAEAKILLRSGSKKQRPSPSAT